MGRSRSATLVIAYLLYDASRRRRRCNDTIPPSLPPDPHPPRASETPNARPELRRLSLDPSPDFPRPAIPLYGDEALSPQRTLRHLRLTRPLAQPNPSFMRQLDLYASLGCPSDPASTPGYQRWVFHQHVRRCVDRGAAPRVRGVRFEDQHSSGTVEGAGGEGERDVRCAKCDTLLARPDWLVVKHSPSRSHDERSESQSEPLSLTSGRKKNGKKECSHIWTHPLSWMVGTLIEGRLEGTLSCPDRRCKAMIGEFAWGGVRCACGGWVRPGFGLRRKKVRVSRGNEEKVDAKVRL